MVSKRIVQEEAESVRLRKDQLRFASNMPAENEPTFILLYKPIELLVRPIESALRIVYPAF